MWGSRAHGLPGFVLLVHRNRQLGFDLAQVEQTGGPVCCEVTTNVLYNLSRLALGLPSLTDTIIARMYDEQEAVFRPLARPEPRRRPAFTWSALSPLALPDLPDDIGRQLVERHLLDPSSFWLPVPPPSVAASDPSFSADDTGLLGVRRYWRGPTWVNAGWLLWMGLVRLGYEKEAAELVGRLSGAVQREGLREYYDPRKGRGMGAADFGWSALVLELVEPDPNAGRSYL
jgi:hypothetical protein